MKRLMLLSNSTNFGEGYLDHAMESIHHFFGGARRIAFVPFAIHDRRAYAEGVRSRFAREGIDVDGVIEGRPGRGTLESAEAIFVGGGNTFRLLDALQRDALVGVLRGRALAGVPYLGASAGSVIAAPTLKTTNDMPIVQPASFEALGLVPFQINAHYMDPDPASHHMGETRETRIREYLEENEGPVVGLREGAWLAVEGESVRLEGRAGARIFRRGLEPIEVAPGSSLSEQLHGSGTPSP